MKNSIKNMRKIVACLAMMIMVAACVKSDPAFVNFDSGVQNPFTFTAAGGSQSIGIQSNAAWTVSVDGSWLNVSPLSGNGNGSIVIKADAYEDKTDRKATVAVTVEGRKATLTVVQKGKEIIVKEYEDIADIRALYTGTDVKINGNIKIKGSVISDYRSSELGGLNNATSNKTIIISDGVAGIMLYCKDANTAFAFGDELAVDLNGQTLSRYQNGALQVNGIPLVNIKKLGTNKLNAKEITAAELLTKNYESVYVAVKDVQVATSDLSKTFVTGGAHTSIRVEANGGGSFDIFSSSYSTFGSEKVPQGSGTLKGIAGQYGERVQISFAKKGDWSGLTGARFSVPTFVLEATEKTVRGDAGSIAISLIANVSWKATCDNNDFVLSKTSGTGTAEIDIKFTDNPSSTSTRKAVVTFTTEDASIDVKTITLTITQSAYQTLVSDPVSKWMELPEIVEKDGFAYVTHDMSYSGKSARNFSMWYDSENKLALWVAYPLCKEHLSGVQRTDAWEYDPKVPARYQPVLYKSYVSTAHDRGHQLPSADRLCSTDANAQTFYFTNMTAQNASLNQNIWGDLEGKIRNVAKNVDTVYVVTGAVLKINDSDVIEYQYDVNSNKVGCPKAYFKVALSYKKNGTNNGGYSAIGFWFENKAASDQFISAKHAMTVDEIEKMTGYNFFKNLNGEIEKAVESNVVLSDWGL